MKLLYPLLAISLYCISAPIQAANIVKCQFNDKVAGFEQEVVPGSWFSKENSILDFAILSVGLKDEGLQVLAGLVVFKDNSTHPIRKLLPKPSAFTFGDLKYGASEVVEHLSELPKPYAGARPHYNAPRFFSAVTDHMSVEFFYSTATQRSTITKDGNGVSSINMYVSSRSGAAPHLLPCEPIAMIPNVSDKDHSVLSNLINHWAASAALSK